MKHLYIFTLFLFNCCLVFSQDTFSIVVVDSTSGEVGSAGCSCLQAPNPPMGCLIISDVIPGRGAVHTQAMWNDYNQKAAHEYLDQGTLPTEMLDNLTASDETGDSTIRQYGVAMFDGNGSPQTGAFTGVGCGNYKGHRLGSYYSIQGNILLGGQILDSMEARFVRAKGPLYDRLMACLQGANVPGADSRCLGEGVPGQSAFIRVAKPTDNKDTLYMDLRVISRPDSMSPIDSLQTLFDAWKVEHPVLNAVNEIEELLVRIYPNPAHAVCNIQFADNKRRTVKVSDVLGNTFYETECNARLQFSTSHFPTGIYFITAGNTVHKLLVE